MGIILIIIGILIIGIILFYCAVKADDYSLKGELLSEFSIMLVVVSGLALLICLLMICSVHSRHNTYIDMIAAKETRESLVKQLSIVTSDYEDVSKTEVIEKITEWNIKCKKDSYYASSFWYNWFYNWEVIAKEIPIDISDL